MTGLVQPVDGIVVLAPGRHVVLAPVLSWFWPLEIANL